jgi:polar amino acid transport system ATP-binding protein
MREVRAKARASSRSLFFSIWVAMCCTRVVAGERSGESPLRFRSLVSGLNRGDFDFAMNGLEITADRARVIRFSRPYYVYKLPLVGRAGETRFQSLDQCKAAGGVVGTLEDTAAERLLDRLHVSKKVDDSQVEPYVDLELGRIDAVLLDLPIAVYYAQPNAKLKFVGEPLASGYYAIGFRKDQEALARKFDAARQVRRLVGMIFQDFQLFPHLTALGNLIEVPHRVLGLSKAEAKGRAMDLLARVGLADRASAYPRELSGGQKQRVAIARAMAMEPRGLLCDEITSALDPELKGEVLAVLEDLKRDGLTLVVVTHEMGFARRAADRIVVLDEGKVVEEGPPAQVLDRPQTARTRQFLSQVLA